MTGIAPSQSPTGLARIRKEIEQGLHDNSSPRIVARALCQVTEADLDIVLKGEKSQAGTNSSLEVVHYTSLSNVIAMLKPDDDGNERYLRMYSTIGFNDPSEGRYFIDLAREKSKFLKELLPEGGVDADPAYIASFIRVDSSNSESHHNMDPADHLMFWRAYGREGTGCSLTLFFDDKEDEIHNVVYGKRNTIKNIKSIERELQQLFNVADVAFDAAIARGVIRQDELSDDMQSARRSKWLNLQSSIRLNRSRYLYKSDPFQYETECRFIVTPDTADEKGMAIKFDYSGPPSKEVVKKYVEHPSLKLTDKIFQTGSAITLGPLVPNPQHTKEYLEQLLKNANFYGCQVRCSKIDYRRPFYH